MGISDVYGLILFAVLYGVANGLLTILRGMAALRARGMRLVRLDQIGAGGVTGTGGNGVVPDFIPEPWKGLLLFKTKALRVLGSWWPWPLAVAARMCGLHQS